MTPRVAVAGCRRTADAGPTDLYPDPDAAPLQDALEACGAGSALVSWDDPGVAWEAFTHVLISSTWDSVVRPVEYLAWAHRVAGVTRLDNPAPAIEWNIDKVHQRELAAAGVPVIPTQWVRPGENWTLPEAGELVVKPSVSAGGRSTARYSAGDAAAAQHVRTLLDAGQTVMVQEYLPAIDVAGELDLIVVDGALSHAVRKEPALQLGQGIVDEPWERMAWSGLAEPTTDQRAVAQLTLRCVEERLGGRLTYCRIDLVEGPDGRPLVLEVELIDPYLSLDLEAAAASRLARAVLARP